MAARELAVAALGAVCAIEGGKEAADQIGQVRQCASMLAVIRRETGSSKWMALTFTYMLMLAYAESRATYTTAVAPGVG